MKKLFDWKLILILIVLLAGFLRFNQLGAIPSGLTVDEAGVGWDAYSILVTGKDQWNQFLPLHFIAFGDYPAPVLRYLSVLPILLFNLNSFSVRFPSALFGVFSVFLIFLLLRKLFNAKIGLLGSLLLAISPWAVGLSRVSIEPNVAITIFLLGLYFYILSVEKIKYLFISAIFFALVIYTYSAYVLFMPLVALILIVWNWKHIRSNMKQYFLASVLVILILVPNFITKNTTASVRYSQVGITTNINSIGLLATLNEERSACLKDYNSVICRIADNKTILFLTTFLTNYSAHFDIDLLYNSGTPTQYSILPQRGLEYAFEIVFFVFGFARIVKNRDKKGYLLLALLLISPIPDSLTGDGQYGRASIMLPFLLTIEGIGLFSIIEIISSIRVRFAKILSYTVLSLLITSSVIIFWVNYTTYFKNTYAIYSQYGYEYLMKKVYSEKNNYDRIYISRHLNDTKQYVFYLFYNKYDPRKFQDPTNVSYHYDSDGWISVDRIGNIYFVQTIPATNSNSVIYRQNDLIISTPTDFPENEKAVFNVRDKLGNVIFKAVKS